MPTAKNGFHILNLHPKKYIFKKKLLLNANLIENSQSGEVTWKSNYKGLDNTLNEVTQFRSQPGTDNFVLSVGCGVRFLASLCYQEHSYSYGGVNCLNSVPYRCYTYV